MSAPSPRPVGSCYGFQICSSLRFGFLREGPGDPLLVEEEQPASPELPPLVAWEPRPDNPLHARLYPGSREGTFHLWVEEGGWYRVDPAGGSIGVPAGGDPLMREVRLWGLPLLLCMLHRGDLSLHAASVQVGDRAVLLAAPSRHGKTSLAAAFLAEGHRLLSEDLSCIRSGEAPAAVPGPTGLRIRPDMDSLLPLPGTREVAVTEDRVHLALEDPGTCLPVPLAGIVLVKDRADRVSLEPVPPMAGLKDLWFLSFHLPTPEGRERKLAGLADLVDRVRVWDLFRPMRVDGLRPTVEAIVAVL
ncbi:MAG: hypothetical protein ACRDVM_10160 [Acidimicrobiia bacterium]